MLPRLRYFDSVDLESISQTYSHSHSHRKERATTSSSAVHHTPQRGGASKTSASALTDRRLPDLPDEVRSVRSGGGSVPGGSKMSFADRKREFERRVCTALGQRRRTAASSVASSSSPLPSSGERFSPPTRAVSRSRSAVGSSGAAPRPPPALFDYNSQNQFSDDEDDLEMQSVQESIQQLNSSIRGRHTPTATSIATAVVAAAPTEDEESVSEAGFFAHTAAHAGKRRPGAPSLIQHWAGHHTSAEALSGVSAGTTVPEIDINSTLLEPTQSIRNRASFYGTISGSQRFPNHPVVREFICVNYCPDFHLCLHFGTFLI